MRYRAERHKGIKVIRLSLEPFMMNAISVWRFRLLRKLVNKDGNFHDWLMELPERHEKGLKA